MLDQIRYLASWTSVKLSKRLGQRGAEMVEYAIVLACIAIIGTWFYGMRDKPTNGGQASGEAAKTLWGSVNNLFYNVMQIVKNKTN